MHGDPFNFMKLLIPYMGTFTQVAALLDYGEPQILELFKKTPCPVDFIVCSTK